MIMGLDLAGSEKRDTGFCFLGRKTDVKILHTDKEILEEIRKCKPKLVAIDAPLSLPKGRRNIEDRKGPHFRKCDLELRRLGIRFFPITLGPMRMLTQRGMALKKKIQRLGPEVIEVYPGATYDVFGVKRKDRKQIASWLKKHGIKTKAWTQDEFDAVACALTGRWYLHGKAKGIGDPKEGLIVIPLEK